MSDKHLEEAINAAVDRALERQLSSLREKVVAEVLRELSATSGKAAHTSAEVLQKAVAAVQSGSTQKEILRALLENTVLACGRAALFVVKGGAATGWHGVGFSSNESVKDLALDMSSELAAAAMRSRSAESGSLSGADQNFLSKMGTPADDRAAVLPLLLKDKVSALIYADAGENGTLDVSALDVLVRATSSWLEVVSQRKQAQKEGSADAAEMHAAPPMNDPFAAHAPIHSAKAEAIPQVAPEEAPAAAMSVAAGVGTVSAGAPTSAGREDSEVHKKAQRFARLLMDEIKLYNQAKVAEGRKHKDLYDRLKDDIEKSRGTYQKRYGNTAAASADYFSQELIRSLAEDDVTLLGGNFRR